MFNEATEHTEGWTSADGFKGTLGWAAALLRDGDGAAPALTEAAYLASPLARSVVGRGPWQWAGQGPLLFYRGGRVHTPWGSGSWSVGGPAGGGAGPEGGTVEVALGKCGRWSLVFAPSGKTFAATRRDATGAPTSGDSTSGSLAAPHSRDLSNEDPPSPAGWVTKAAAEAVGSRPTADSPLAKRLIGSGPWAWTGVSALAFLPDGRLHTPWGRGHWLPMPGKPNTVRARFVGQDHAVTFDECWSFESRRDTDGDLATGAAKIEPGAETCPELQGTAAKARQTWE